MNTTEPVRQGIEDAIREREEVLARVLRIEKERTMQGKFRSHQVREMEAIVRDYCPNVTPYPRSLKIALTAHINKLTEYLKTENFEECSV